jgi:hypothetical protein
MAKADKVWILIEGAEGAEPKFLHVYDTEAEGQVEGRRLASAHRERRYALCGPITADMDPKELGYKLADTISLLWYSAGEA